MRTLSEKVGQRTVDFFLKQEGWENSEYVQKSVYICARATGNTEEHTPSLNWLFQGLGWR